MKVDAVGLIMASAAWMLSLFLALGTAILAGVAIVTGDLGAGLCVPLALALTLACIGWSIEITGMALYKDPWKRDKW